MGDTTIRVSEALADELYKRKGRSNSYEDYIWELLAEVEGVEKRTDTVGRREEAGINTAIPIPEGPRDVLDVAAIVREYFKTKHSPDPSSRTIHTRAAVADIVAYLRREGPTKPSTIRKAVYESHAEEWSDARTMWKSIGQKLYICGIPGVERSGEEWAYTGDAELIKQVE